MEVVLDTKSIDDYRTFLKIKQLPAWSIRGSVAAFPDQYADVVGLKASPVKHEFNAEPWLYDYQRDIAQIAVQRKKFAVFADCGRGKTLIYLSYAREVLDRIGSRKNVLIVTPKLVIPQVINEAKRFWGDDYPIKQVKASEMAGWMIAKSSSIGITNYESLKSDLPQGLLGCLILDESSVLKSHYGNWAGVCLRLGNGLDYKLALTGTPAPNDRIEYANHATFLDRFPTVNSFLATYFINRGKTGERWEIKPHAVKAFYRSLSDWSIFLSDPSVYGWQDGCEPLPPIYTHIHEVELTPQQRDWVANTTGQMIATKPGGITTRAGFGQVSKGCYKGVEYETNKYGTMKDLMKSWRDTESTLVWCLYDHEQARCHAELGGDSMDGKTKDNARLEMIERFKSRQTDCLISKPKILGFGLNLQVATRQVFSGLQDSYESFYQAVKRSNRIGSSHPLNVHIPVTELEEPMIATVLEKARRVESDTREQEMLFKENAVALGAQQ
jgi:hypothetical protein